MKQVIDEYGKTILLVIVSSMCLVMFCNVWFGSGSLISNLGTTVFSLSTSDSKITSTNDDGSMLIIRADGSSILESQQKTAIMSEKIANRAEPILHSVGSQNDTTQLLIGTQYASTDLLWAVDADGKIISKSLDSTNAIKNDGTEDANHFNDGNLDSGYFRILSVSKANGDSIISNCSDFSSISYYDREYTSKVGSAGTNSYTTSELFFIKAPDDTNWFSYNVATQNWYFYKSGTYCLNVFVCDSEGKSMTGTVYISVAKNITKNAGDGSSAVVH